MLTACCRRDPESTLQLADRLLGVAGQAGVMKPCMGDMHAAIAISRRRFSGSVWFCVLSTTTATMNCKNPNGSNKNHNKTINTPTAELTWP